MLLKSCVAKEEWHALEAVRLVSGAVVKLGVPERSSPYRTPCESAAAVLMPSKYALMLIECRHGSVGATSNEGSVVCASDASVVSALVRCDLYSDTKLLPRAT